MRTVLIYGLEPFSRSQVSPRSFKVEAYLQRAAAMFKKKPALKPSAPIRSSDRRKTAARLIRMFDLAPSVTEDDSPPDDAAPPTTDSSITLLRSTLLPENTSHAKFTTTLGPDLRPVNGLIYSGAHPTSQILDDKVHPLWVASGDVEGSGNLYDGWFPSVYTAWELASDGLLPIVYTHDAVMDKVFGGADLMMPGVVGVVRRQSDDGVQQGALVGVADYKKENVVLAVGIAEANIPASGGRGGKGKAVRILHWVGDELWALGGGLTPPERLAVSWGDGGVSEQVGGEEAGGVPLEAQRDEGESSGSTAAEKQPSHGPAADRDDEGEHPYPELTTAEVDNAFRDALVYSLYNVLQSPDRVSNAHHALKFPLSSAYVLSELILPRLPSENPGYHIQKTSWRKVQKMLKQMDKDNLLKIKERGGDVLVYAVNWDCDMITSFTPYPIDRSKKVSEGKKPEASTSGSSSSSSAATVKIRELYKPPVKAAAIYDITETPLKAFYNASQVRETLYKYFAAPTPTDDSLVLPTNARMISLNPTLADLLIDDSRDVEILRAGRATRDMLAERFLRLHAPYYSIVLPNGEESKPRAGQPPKVVITLESRQGRKTVTRVKGMETFGVDAGKFMEELKSVAASSVTKGPIEGGGKAAEGMVEVMVQGDKTAEVERLLVKAGVRKADITLDNKLKKKK
ncbi:hypothetical protein Dda_8394 [Drechslerella dactyloides]|uniref:SUI1 domain-containing protein n=1 Tax=Drechslerella dactyloides TaxID=74499 RepID=A0AAD6IQK5_DREDA|nr:hypothetical protein Dda_8394 [Drechslerella dactyloides]